MWWMHSGYAIDGWWWGMGFWMLIVWLPLIAGGFWLLQLLTRGAGAAGGTGSPPPRDEPDAREIARRAYASGQMDRERYLQVMQDLDAHEHRGTPH